MCIFSKFLRFVLSVLLCVSLTLVSSAADEVKEVRTIKSYKIAFGDVLKINTWKEPDLSIESVFVRIDGKITFPLLDDVQAVGLTTMQLKKDIEKKLADFVEAPHLTVTLINPGSQKFYMMGEVANIGEYSLIKSLTVMQAFALGGGFTEWASKKEIILIRRIGGNAKTIVINYNDILKGDFSNDIALKADDTIIVP